MPVRPEVECGLGAPRESTRLVGDHAAPPPAHDPKRREPHRQQGGLGPDTRSGVDAEDLRGFAFKSRSPGSGLHGVKGYDEKGTPARRGIGILARAFAKRFPLVPVEDEGRLNDAGIRENSIERVFASHRWRTFVRDDGSLGGLVEFHTVHKLLIVSYDPRSPAALVLLRHYVRKSGEPYLARQAWLDPHPAELALRNHA